MLGLCFAMLDEPEDTVDFEIIYNSCKGKMFALAYGIIGNHHDSEEAVSQAFFAVARSFSKIRGKSRQEQLAYINVATKNAAYDICRRNKQNMGISLEENGEIADNTADTPDTYFEGMEYNRVLEAIKKLPERYAQALYLKCVTGLSIREISQTMHESEANVRQLLARARAKLRKILEDKGITI